MTPLLLLVLGCGTDPQPRDAPEPAPVELPDVTLGDGGDATAPDGQLGRERHRMSVDQLADSLEVVTGRRWMDGDTDQFERFAPTLGVPDWLENTTENRVPDLVFNKLLDDAATQICTELVAEEASGGDVLLVGLDLTSTVDNNRAGIESALSAALFRFHGHDIAPDDVRLGGWVWLFESTTNVTDGDTAMAWTAVCTALIVHPDFYTY